MSPAPVGTEVVEVGGRDPALLAGDPQVQLEAFVGRLDLAQPVGEDHSVGGPRRVDVDDVGDRVEAVEAAQHADDRRDPTAGAEEQQLLGRLIGQDEGAFDAAEADQIAGSCLPHQIRRDLPAVDPLRRDRDPAVGAIRIGGERVGASGGPRRRRRRSAGTGQADAASTRSRAGSGRSRLRASHDRSALSDRAARGSTRAGRSAPDSHQGAAGWTASARREESAGASRGPAVSLLTQPSIFSITLIDVGVMQGSSHNLRSTRTRDSLGSTLRCRLTLRSSTKTTSGTPSPSNRAGAKRSLW